MFSAGSRKLTFTIGSRNSSIWPASGTFCGLSMRSVSPLRGQDFVGDVGRGLHQVELGFAFQPLLDDLAVQHAEEAAAEAEAQALAGLGLELEAGIVELQLGQRLAQLLEVVVVDGIQAADRPSACGSL